MGLIDLAGTQFFDKVKERLQTDINADISDIIEDARRYNADNRNKIKRNIISTWFLSLYDYDAEALHRDITKLVVLEPADDIPKADNLWVAICLDIV